MQSTKKKVETLRGLIFVKKKKYSLTVKKKKNKNKNKNKK